MTSGLEIKGTVVVNGVAYERLKAGTHACIPVDTHIRVNDNLTVSSNDRTMVVTVTEIVYVEYPPDNAKAYNGYPCLVSARPPTERVVQILATIYPIKKEETPVMSNILTIRKWKESLETMAHKLRVKDNDLQRTQAITPINCHFNGRELDEDEFCALDEKEQIACLMRLSETVYTKLNTINRTHEGIIKQVKVLEQLQNY